MKYEQMTHPYSTMKAHGWYHSTISPFIQNIVNGAINRVIGWVKSPIIILCAMLGIIALTTLPVVGVIFTWLWHFTFVGVPTILIVRWMMKRRDENKSY